MLKIGEITNWDLTWFAYDDKGRIAVFFSNGTNCVLTNNILKDKNYEVALDYFNTLHGNSKKLLINESLKNHDSFMNFDIDDFVLYAQKGLLVYDIEDSTQCNYELKVKPSMILMINDISEAISNIIEKYDGIFLDMVKINPSKSSS